MDKRLFAKLNSEGELIIAPHHYEDENTYIMNFDECEELMFNYGFKPIRGKEPEYNRETQNLIINYVEEDTCIRKVCEAIEKVTPQFEVNDIYLSDNFSLLSYISLIYAELKFHELLPNVVSEEAE